MHWSSQKRLQEDLDAILGDRPITEWDYDNDVPKLFGSMCGAVMNEELRLIPPVSSFSVFYPASSINLVDSSALRATNSQDT